MRTDELDEKQDEEYEKRDEEKTCKRLVWKGLGVFLSLKI